MIWFIREKVPYWKNNGDVEYYFYVINHINGDIIISKLNYYSDNDFNTMSYNTNKNDVSYMSGFHDMVKSKASDVINEPCIYYFDHKEVPKNIDEFPYVYKLYIRYRNLNFILEDL